MSLGRDSDGVISRILYTTTGEIRSSYRAVAGLVLTLFAAVVASEAVASVPPPFGDAVHQVVTLCLVLVGAWTFTRLLDGRPVSAYGVALDSQWLRELIGGFVLTASVTAGANVALVGLGLAEVTAVGTVGEAGQYLPGVWNFLFVFVTFVTLFFGIAWEVVGFYGIVAHNLAESVGTLGTERMGVGVALAVVSLLFGLLHIGLGGPLAAAWYTLLGVAVGVAYVETGSLAAPVGLRTGWAIGFAVLVGFSPAPGPQVVSISRSRSELFADTAGVVLTTSALLAVVLVVTWSRLRERTG